MSNYAFVPPPIAPAFVPPPTPVSLAYAAPPQAQAPAAVANPETLEGAIAGYDPALVLKYRQLRDRKDEIKKRHAEELRPFNEALDQIEAVLLDHLNRTGTESSRTKDGTFFKVNRTTYKVDDADALMQWLQANDQLDMLERRVSKTVIEAWLEAGNPLPPGLAVSTETEVQIRKPK